MTARRASTTHAPAAWPQWKRVSFRFVFAYFAQYALCCGQKTVLERLPHVGRLLENVLQAPYNAAALFIAAHWLHLTGASIRPHGTGFGDRAVDWLACGLMLAIAAATTVIWTLLDRRRPTYTTLFAWLRFGLRLTLGLSILWYASIKLFPIQIETPSLSVLNEPLGQVAPMSLLWATLAYSHAYERICGLAELMGGLLILIRPTALLGAATTAIVLLNIVLFNLFFDVAVKLYSINLLLMCVVILAPDAPALWSFFILHKPAAPRSTWVPPSSQKRFTQATAIIEAVFLLSCLNPMRTSYRQYALESRNAAHPSPLAGQWHVVEATLKGAPHPFPTGDGLPLSDIFLEPDGRDSLRSSDGVLWLGGRYDRAPGQLDMVTPARTLVIYSVAQPDARTLVLTPPSSAADLPTLRLARVDIPMHFRLYDRGFHWINEWGLER